MRVFQENGRLFFVETRTEPSRMRLGVANSKKTTPNWKWSEAVFVHSIGNFVRVVNSPNPYKRESDEAN